MSDATVYVVTADIKAAVQGHEEDILDAIGINWRQRGTHIDCPYPDHGGRSDWRWDAKKLRAYCTCATKGDHIIEVLRRCEGLDFDAAKLRATDMIGRSDLIKTKGGKGQKTDAFSLLNPSTSNWDRDLPRAYLAHRLGIEVGQVLMPVTKAAGWRALAYFDPPAKGSTKPILVGEFPCVVFGTVAADGTTHAHRIYTAPGGAGKADLGQNAAGYERDPKKSAKTAEGTSSTAGRSVIWGDPQTVERIVVAEGIETAAAVAHAFRQEIEAGKVAVAAAIAAGGVAAFQIYPTTKRVTVAADRDEAVKPSKPAASRTGEKMAREFGMRNHERVGIDIAMPGRSGASTDWLDIMLSDGADAVRAGIEGAVKFVPTRSELDERAQRAGRQAELQEVAATYPLPHLHSKKLMYSHACGRIWVHKVVMVGKGEDKVEIEVPICTPFGMPARLRYLDQSDTYGLRIMVQDMGGTPRPIDVDRGDFAKMGAAEARAMLFAAGLRVEDDGEKVAVECLKAADPADEILLVKRPGWHEIEGIEDPIFVCPDGDILGLPEGRHFELSVASRLSASVSRGGTLQGWKDAVASAAAVRGCEHWTIGIIAGFAGPIISLTGLDTCGMNFSGLSSSGKTTGQRLAVSPWSKAVTNKDSLFQSAKATVNSMEQMAARANGTVLVLDELAHVSGKEVGKAIYMIAGNVGKKRMTAGAAVRDSYVWSTFALLSAETSLEAKVTSDGGEWTAGMAVRFADVDVTGVNRLVDAATLAKINSISDHYGHAGPAFIQALIKAGTHRSPDDLRAGINELARRLVGKGSDGGAPDSALLRAAHPFAVLLMAGLLAKEYGLLPATTDVGGAVKWAWGRFQGSSDAEALDPAAQAMANLRTWIAERWTTSIHGIHAELRPTRDALGWFDDDAVYLTPHRLIEAAGGVLKEAEIAKALDAARGIAKRKSEKHTFVEWVPKIGKLKVYALSRTHFGHEAQSEKQGLKTYMGGRP